MSLRRLSILFVSLVGASLLTGAALLVPVQPVSAQAGTPVIQSGSLRLWPEYDKPGLLVIIDGTFSNTVTFPKEMVFTLPAGAHDIQTTMKDASGGLLTQAWHMDGNKLSFTLPGAGFQVEYYVDTPLLGSQRNLSYAFQVPYTIEKLEIEVQQPARATNFSVVPQPESSSPGSDGLTYYHLLRSNVAAGQSLPITIQYGKADQGTSVTPVPAAGLGAPPGGPGARHPARAADRTGRAGVPRCARLLYPAAAPAGGPGCVSLDPPGQTDARAFRLAQRGRDNRQRTGRFLS
jgi:hypothetical protein